MVRAVRRHLDAGRSLHGTTERSHSRRTASPSSIDSVCALRLQSCYELAPAELARCVIDGSR